MEDKKIFEITLHLENSYEWTDEEKKLIIKGIKKACLMGKYPHGYFLTKMWSRLVPGETLKLERSALDVINVVK